MLGAIGIRVNPLMQRWRNGQGERPKKRAQNSGGNDRARRYRLSPGETKSHVREDCPFNRSGATQFRFSLPFQFIRCSMFDVGRWAFSSIQRTSHTQPRLIQDVGINHRRRDILVAQQLLNRANVIPVLE